MHIDDLTSSDGRMDDRAGPAADDGARTAPTWDAFEERLAAVLRRMAVDSHLVISTRDADGSAYFVRFAQAGRPGFRAEAVGNSLLAGLRALSPAQEERLGRIGWQWPSDDGSDARSFSRQWPQRAPFRDVARLAVRTLRDVYGIRRPADLVYRRFDDTGRDFAEPELGIPVEAPDPGRTGSADGSPRAAAGTCATPDPRPRADVDPLDALAERGVAAFLCIDHVVRDDDGDIPVRVGDAAFFVRVLEGPSPAVRVFAPALGATPPTYALLAAVNEANTRLRYARALWVCGEVIVAAEVPAAHATEALVALACAEVAALAGTLAAELGPRFGPGVGHPRPRPTVH